ncbi:MAG: hypothetical protein WCP60_00870 [bacterium]
MNESFVLKKIAENIVQSHNNFIGILLQLLKVNYRYVLLAIAAIAILFKLWLVNCNGIEARGFEYYDDQLFISHATAILKGRWLGDYSQGTLMKGPMYPLFIAGSYYLGIPLFTAQHILYIIACTITILSLKKIVGSEVWLLVIYIILIYNPITYDTASNMRVLRQNLNPSLCLMIAASLIALNLVENTSVKTRIIWGITLGLSTAAFYLTREDTVWLTPLFFILISWGLLKNIHLPNFRFIVLFSIIIPFVIAVIPILKISYKNLEWYGLFSTCEFRSASFKNAYGAITRVKPEIWYPLIPCSRSTRLKIYGISPSFKQLEPFLEGDIGKGWANNGQERLPQSAQGEIVGGWFMWALRDAVRESGHARNAREAMDFYQQVSDEINSACDRGLLAAGPRRSTFTPQFNKEYIQPFLSTLINVMQFLFNFKGINAQELKPSIGTQESLISFADITNCKLNPTLDRINKTILASNKLDKMKINILAKISTVYLITVPALLKISFLIVILTFFIKKIRSINGMDIIALYISLLLSCCVLVAIISLIEVSSFHAMGTDYLSGCYGLILMAICVSPFALLINKKYLNINNNLI